MLTNRNLSSGNSVQYVLRLLKLICRKCYLYLILKPQPFLPKKLHVCEIHVFCWWEIFDNVKSQTIVSYAFLMGEIAHFNLKKGTEAGGMDPTGMLSCFVLFSYNVLINCKS